MNLLVSYFEIDGQIIELDTIEDPLQVSISPSALEASMRLHEREMIAFELTGDPNTLHIKDADYADVMPKPKSGVKMARNLSRAGRAHRALVLAGTVAAADGPLPIGDVVAIGILTAYAGYETYRIIDDLS